MTNGTADAHLRDSCSYGVEIAKQFITLASAGIAFVVGLALSGAAPTWRHGVIIGVLALSVTAGLVFLMRVVGIINRTASYDVYSRGLAGLAGAQILLFVVAIGALGDLVRREAGQPRRADAMSLELVAGEKTVRYSVPQGASAKVTIDANNVINVAVTSSH